MFRPEDGRSIEDCLRTGFSTSVSCLIALFLVGTPLLPLPLTEVFELRAVDGLECVLFIDTR